MKFLIDNNISRRICSHLRAAGYEAVHVEALSMADAEDVEIVERAREMGAVVVSSDTDSASCSRSSARRRRRSFSPERCRRCAPRSWRS